MCLVFVAWRVHPRCRLVVAANRDEYHARPTAPAAVWEAEREPSGADRSSARAAEAPGAVPVDEGAAARAARRVGSGAGPARGCILAGRDLLAGGTWLGVSPEGRFAALTNVSGSAPPGPGAPSRGRLPVDFLGGEVTARKYAREVSREADRYRGFNLLFADRDDLFCVSNRGRERLTELEPGFHGLGNDRLNVPEPKVTGGLGEFRRVLHPDFAADDLFALLADDEPASEGDVGGGSTFERARSARFIRSAAYGTRSSTVVRVFRTGRVDFDERSFDPRGVEVGRVSFSRGAASDRDFVRVDPALPSRTAAAD